MSLPICDKDIYVNGQVAFVMAGATAMQIEEYVHSIQKKSAQVLDWHYSGGRAVVKTFGDVERVRKIAAENLDHRFQFLNELYSEPVATPLAEPLNTSSVLLRDMSLLDPHRIQSFDLYNSTQDFTKLHVHYMLTKDFPLVELFHVDELGNTSERDRFKTDRAEIEFLDENGTYFKGVSLLDVELVETRLQDISRKPVYPLTIELVYNVNRVR